MKLHKLMKKAQEGDKIEVFLYAEDGITRTGRVYAVLQDGELQLWDEESPYAFRIEAYFKLSELLRADYKIVERQQYYLVLNKCYADNKYLNYAIYKDGGTNVLLSTRTELDEAGLIKYQTKFTKQEIHKLIDEFGSDIMDFEMVEAKANDLYIELEITKE